VDSPSAHSARNLSIASTDQSMAGLPDPPNY
jgi:hypothetical protein